MTVRGLEARLARVEACIGVDDHSALIEEAGRIRRALRTDKAWGTHRGTHSHKSGGRKYVESADEIRKLIKVRELIAPVPSESGHECGYRFQAPT